MLLPLTNAQRIARFGRLQFRADPIPTNPERVHILGGWAEKNIADVRCRQLANQFKKNHVNLNYSCVQPFLDLWDAWEERGLLPLIESFNGSWVARFKRQNGTVEARMAKCLKLGAASLSNHSWGTAFDVNAKKYPLGRPLAAEDPFWECVVVAEEFGWFSGARFKSRPDPMHFEYAGRKK